jgi:hypothetical protein
MSKKKQVFRNVVGKNNYNEFLKQKKLKIVAKYFHPRCFRTACPDFRELHPRISGARCVALRKTKNQDRI